MKEDLNDKLDRLEAIEGNDGEDGGPVVLVPSPKAIEGARAFLLTTDVSVDAHGRVEWRGEAGQWEVKLTFHEDGTATVLYGHLA